MDNPWGYKRSDVTPSGSSHTWCSRPGKRSTRDSMEGQYLRDGDSIHFEFMLNAYNVKHLRCVFVLTWDLCYLAVCDSWDEDSPSPLSPHQVLYKWGGRAAAPQATKYLINQTWIHLNVHKYKYLEWVLHLAACLGIQEAERSRMLVRRVKTGQRKVHRILHNPGRGASPESASPEPQPLPQRMRQSSTWRSVSNPTPGWRGLAHEERARQESASSENHRAGWDHVAPICWESRERMIKWLALSVSPDLPIKS